MLRNNSTQAVPMAFAHFDGKVRATPIIEPITKAMIQAHRAVAIVHNRPLSSNCA